MFETVAILLVLGSIFGYLNYRLFQLPFAIAMMIAGLMASMAVLGADAIFTDWHLGADLRRLALEDVNFSEALMRGMLSFLLFAGALHTDMTVMNKFKWPIISLASVGVCISTAMIGFGTYGILAMLGHEVPMIWCLVFGALISPTDPVAVLGIMKAAGAPKPVEIQVVGESLFNDGVGVVIFTVLLSIAMGGAHGSAEMDAAGIVMLISKEVIGGVLLGLGAGWITYLALKDLEEPNLETLITVAMVMGVSLVAFRLHTSAPLACVVAGLFVGNKGRADAMSEETEQSLDTVWSFIDEALNAVLFLLVGLEVLAFEFNRLTLTAAGLIIVLNLTARTVSVLIPINILRRRMTFVPGTRRILIWGGIKGGISVALALSLPEFPGRELILTATYAVVVTSILTQGLTVGKLINVIKQQERAAI